MKSKSNSQPLFFKRFSGKAATSGLLCLLLFSSTQTIMADPGINEGQNQETVQQKGPVVTGVVTDAKGGPLVGVNVTVKGTTNGVVTDINGKYTLQVPNQNSTLVVSYIGFQTRHIAVGNSHTIKVVLDEDSKSLEELVVVGYGSQRKSDLTGAVASVKAGDLTKIGGSNVAEALQGKAAGVEIKNVGGPGSSPLVFVRGLGTNGDASPLYVVDGMMVGNINFLTSNDIASMEILKDASATAIYGSRGANGVVLITTKKGTTGKTVVNFTATHGYQYLTRKYETCNPQEYARLVNLFMTNSGKAALYSDPNAITGGTDWLKEVLQKGEANEYQLSVSGGTDNVNYNLSTSYFKEDGILKYTGFDRFTLRANNDYKINKRIKIGHELTMASSNTYGNAGWNGGRGINSIYRISPLLAVRRSESAFTQGQDVDVVNPVAALYYNKDYVYHPIQFVGTGWFNYEILDGLVFRSSYGTDFSYNRITNVTPVYSLGSNQSNGSNTIEEGYATNYTWLWENTLTYDKIFGKDHHINVLAGYTSQESNYKQLDLLGANLSTTDSNVAQTIMATSTSNLSYNNTALPTNESILSYLGRVNYTYKNRYLLTASLRSDGSSKFAKNKRWGTFPSVALGWNVSEESFLKNNPWVDKLKIRASWGQIGSNKISNYQTYSLLNSDANKEYNGVFNGVFYPDVSITSASNPNLTWEVEEQEDLGFEFATLKGKLKVEADYYSRDTKNLLIALPVPGGSTGFGIAASNAGKIRNSGFEFQVSWNDKISDFNYGVKFTGSTNKNEVLDLHGQKFYLSDWMVNSQHIMFEGYPMGVFYGYKVAGIAKDQAAIDALNASAAAKTGVSAQKYYTLGTLSPGDLIFQDINGDGKVDANDRTDIGNPNPKFVGGLTLTVAYKGFDFAIDMMGSFGGKIYNNTRNQILSSGLSNMNKEWLDSWTTSNPNATLPRYAYNTSLGQVSDFGISDGTYLKARNIELGYTFDKKLLSKIKVGGLRLFVNVNNAFYITKYKGFSPEVSNSYGVTTMGDDFRTYPVTATVKGGVNITL